MVYTEKKNQFEVEKGVRTFPFLASCWTTAESAFYVHPVSDSNIDTIESELRIRFLINIHVDTVLLKENS
jgi:hypothetical protein